MKKLISLFIISLALSSALFALGDRYAEVRTDVDFGLSNNYWGAKDILKENIEIDFTKIAEEMPKKGWVFDGNLNVSESFNFNFRKVEVKFKSGIEWNSNLNFGRGIFDLLGKGYEAGETLEFSTEGRADIFEVTSLTVGVNGKHFGLHFTPSAFIPLAHLSVDSTKMSITNTDDSELLVDFTGNASLYTFFDFGTGGTFDSSDLARIMGYDLRADVIIPVGKRFSVTASTRVPVIPGTLNYRTPVSASANYVVSAKRFIDGTMEDPEFNYDVEASTNDSLSINRPLKFSADFSMKTKKGGIVFDVLGGGALRYPFSEAMYFYPEYRVALKLCAWNALGINLSTEYTDEIFAHNLGFRLNCRVFEFDFGMSLEGGSFINSFKGTGAGGYFTFCMGF